MKNCVIVANGDFARHSVPLNTLANADFVIACDGACDKLYNNNFSFDVGIGDFDSIDISKFKDKNLIHIKEQDTNDLCKAFVYALNFNFKNITILCASGLRDDHHIGNIFYLEYFIKLIEGRGVRVSIQTDFGEFFCYKGSFLQECKKGQQISLFSTDKNAVFTSRGLKYEIENFKFDYIFTGTLNEANGDNFEIITDDKNILIVYLSYS